MAKKRIPGSSFTQPIDIKKDFRESPTGIWMLIGLIGAGKTTLAQQLWATDPKRTIRSSLDEIIQMMSFYRYEPEMSGFYSRIERSTIIDGLLDGYKVIIDRTNLTRKIRRDFISIVRALQDIAGDFLGLVSALGELDFFEQCERNLIEQTLLAESKKNVSLSTSVLKLIRDWKAQKTQPALFASASSPIKRQLKRIMQIEICGFWFAIPEKVCRRRRAADPRNALRDIAKKVDWRAVIRRMAKQLEPPQMSEGFDRLY